MIQAGLGYGRVSGQVGHGPSGDMGHGACTVYTGWYERHGAGTGLYGGRESGVRAVYMVSGVQEGRERHGVG